MQFPRVISVNPIKKYKLKLVFSDGTEGVYDLANLAGKGVFEIWDVNDNFFKVFINRDSGAISWPGDIDIDVVNVYCTIRNISPEHYFNEQMKNAANQ